MKGLSSLPQGASSSLVLDTQGQPEISRGYSLTRLSLITQQAVCMQTQRHICTIVCYFSIFLSNVCYVNFLILSSLWVSTKEKPATYQF